MRTTLDPASADLEHPSSRAEALASALGRRVVAAGATGAVAAGAGAAATIGASMLLRGGNAVDAALAAALAETVLLPSKCGLGGDLVALVLTPEHREPRACIAIGPAAAGLADAATAQGWHDRPTGGLSVGVPGAPAGYAALHSLARLPLAVLAEPAVALARAGIVWNRFHARLAGEADDLLLHHQPDGCRYRPRVAPLDVGTRLQLPGLATLLERFVASGAALFAEDVGTDLVDYVGQHGGVITADDLAAARARWEAVDTVTLPGGRTLVTTPAPTYGPALSRVLATRPAQAGPVPPGDVLTALAGLRSGGPRDSGTSSVAAADAHGNAVVVVHSNSFPQFGSGLVLPGHDLVLSNRAGRGFTWRPDHPNSPAPGRRPLTTLHAWGLSDGPGWLLGATPGGEQQVPWNVQVLQRLLQDPSPDGLAAAMLAPKWDADAAGRIAEDGVTRPDLSARSAHTVVRTVTDGVVHAAADPRLEATAVAL